ncbi:TetR/AcrR family transcriptional regulator [Govanella unica]|uniref:TetR/AcrR family transcriptional regulator n=1 Tax=Govanella unica TaxID=2975056 RepID=A0A9X3TXH8_9PROT|nr:TetR/AcrR family transcriptional regulator [Govania unica]MDA5193514.1 TetR/AcrR family transcriptional regulator [Govania unica]
MLSKTDQSGKRDDERAPPRVDNRRELLMSAAARLFAKHGYAGTSVRDIAAAVGMLPGSMYYHFKSKEELLLTVHAEGVAHIYGAVQARLVTAGDEPWERLRAASVAHLTAVLDGSHYSMIMTPEFHLGIENELRLQVVAQRDAYETLFKTLIDALPLPDGTNRAYLRLGIFGSLNWAMTWFRPGGDSAEKIAGEMIDLYRRKLDPSA